MKTKIAVLLIGFLVTGIAAAQGPNVSVINSGQFSRAAAVTPSDTAKLTPATNALYIGVSGDVKVDLANAGSAIVFKAVPVGILPVRATRVYSTGTTATNILALRN